ncbi:MAG: hypothetical protein NVS2B9_00550 [Myxococcales bacterium]
MTWLESPILRFVVGAAALGGLLVAERLRPLRIATRSKWRRLVVNLSVAALGGATLALAYGPVVLGTLAEAHRQGFGLLRWLGLPRWLSVGVGIVLLDYSLWAWHLANHRVPLLWRFHAAHHLDEDLDASTALRFHPGELLLSVPFRALQVAIIGVDVPTLFAWETALLVATELHHSNVRLPLDFDRALRLLLVTPRMHGVHHSVVASEVNSNFGTLLTVWDRLHRTFVHGVPQRQIVIGLPGRREGGLLGALSFPFTRGLRPPQFTRASSTQS